MDEDDLKRVANENKILLLLKSSMKIFVLKLTCFRKLSHSAEMQNDALVHCEGLKDNKLNIITLLLRIIRLGSH